MKFSQKVLRWLCPLAEKERMEFRKDIKRVTAHAEDLARTVTGIHQQKQLEKDDVMRSRK